MEKQIIICNDCGNEIRKGGRIKSVSARYGLVYEGEPLCDACCEIRYEDKIIEHETEYENDHLIQEK